MASLARKVKSKVSKLNPFKAKREPSPSRSEVTVDNVVPVGVLHEGEEGLGIRDSNKQDSRPAKHTVPDEVDLRKAVDNANKALFSLHSPGECTPQAADAVEPTTEDAKSTSELWEPILEKVQIFASLVEGIGNVHPYAKVATSILLSVIKPVIAQDKRDKSITDLLAAMDDLYDFVVAAGRIDYMDEDRKELLVKMSMQTLECAYFIRDNARVSNFWFRAASNAITGTQIDSHISDFTKAFRDLRRRFTESGVVAIELKLTCLVDINTNVGLQNLVHVVQGAGLKSSKSCLEGTRRETLDELKAWINDPDGPPVGFLLGGAGTGKSSIAHSIGQYFKPLNRLGSFYCFDRSFGEGRSPNVVIPTIARDLADWNSDFCKALVNVVNRRRGLGRSTDIEEQWEELILEPLKAISLVGPVLVVIDAFDESSSAEGRTRELLLKCLTNCRTEHTARLPSNFRIVITSRPERDVRVAIGRADRDYLRSMNLDEKNREARLDIEPYVRHELDPDEPDMEGTLDDADIRLLTGKAEGLFQWAATACRAIRDKPAGFTLKEQLDTRLGTILRGGPSSLDNLYRGILAHLFTSDDPVLMARFRSVMGQVLCASSPLSIGSLQHIRRHVTGGETDEITLILRDMGPLLLGVYSPTSPVLPLHTSFRDFLTDVARSGEWHVDLVSGHSTMALGCFRVLNNGLSFNICRLETSYVSNRDNPDLEARLSMHVPQSLSYAAYNWKDHLATIHPLDLQRELSRFLREKLLFWFELLSPLKSVNRAAPSLEAALKGYDEPGSHPSKELLIDAISFVRWFAVVIAQAAPHVYISALPFSLTSSKAHAVLSRHTFWVHSVAYSPDGRHIVSGSSDRTVRVWDAETGESILELSCGSWAAWVQEVAFSPDGHHIAAAVQDSTVRIWDSTTGEAVCEPLQGHEGPVECIVYSPDGRRIVSSDCRGRIYIWST
ncbi:hypothetical protein BD311DRAFT_456237, partial [Dichomitus squalens]